MFRWSRWGKYTGKQVDREDSPGLPVQRVRIIYFNAPAIFTAVEAEPGDAGEPEKSPEPEKAEDEAVKSDTDDAGSVDADEPEESSEPEQAEAKAEVAAEAEVKVSGESEQDQDEQPQDSETEDAGDESPEKVTESDST